MANVRLTTTDNKWNPFTQFPEWLAYDMAHDYGCCDYIGRVVMTADELTDEENELMMESAIDNLVALAIPLPNGAFYKKVRREQTPS